MLVGASSVLTVTEHLQGGVRLDLEAAGEFGIDGGIHLGQFDLRRVIPELSSRLFILGGQLLAMSTPAVREMVRKKMRKTKKVARTV
jgi:hypothetical protein